MQEEALASSHMMGWILLLSGARQHPPSCLIEVFLGGFSVEHFARLHLAKSQSGNIFGCFSQCFRRPC